jgi:hypothetical protein
MMKALKITLLSLSIVTLASCKQEVWVDNSMTDDSEKVLVSFSGKGESDSPDSRVTLDFSQAQNVRWSDNDLIAVFDGTAKNQFSIADGTNTGATATFTGEVTVGYTSLYAVYPYSAGNSHNGSNLSVTVPSTQTVSSTAKVDPAALVSVGQVIAGATEFKQVCGLLKFEINSAGIAKVIIKGTNLAGTATVASATGVVSSISSGENSIVISSSEGTFATGTYYAAVLPGTTAAECFTVAFVESDGLTHERTASGAVSVARKQGKSIGYVDGSYSVSRHIFTKDQLFAWGAAMGSDDHVPVYLEADIDCESDPWTYGTVEFNGTFDGQNHKIFNFVVESASQSCFIYTHSGKLKNVVIGSSNGSSWDNVSRITNTGTSGSIEYVGIVSRLTGKGSIENVTNYAKVEVSSSSNSRAYVGGLVGVIPDSALGVMITDSKNYGAVSNASSWSDAQTRMGGILGQCDGTLTASGIENHGAITVGNNVTNFIGGLCGDLGSGSAVSASKNYGTISFTDGGTSKTYLGGCFGSVRGSTISDCHNYGAITATRNAECWFGGIAGFCESGKTSITDCINHTGADLTVASSVTKRVLMGGITGGCQYNGSGPFAVIIQDCRNDAAVTNSGCASDFGGIAGLFDNYLSSATILIQNCENTGAISSTVENNTSMSRELRVGGIIGGTDPESAGCEQIYRSCINRGMVTVDGALKSGASVRVGGIVGNAYECTTIDKCKNFGNVGSVVGGSDAGSAVFTFGGILGYIHSRSASRYQQVTDCINTGTVSSVRNYNNQYLGGIVGGGTTDNNVYPQVTGCKNFGNISATKTTNTLVGGLCGYIKYTLANSSNFGDVTGGAWNGAVVGDGNSSAVVTTGIKVGDGVEVTGAANAGTKYSEGRNTYSFTTTLTDEKKWFSGWSDAPITATVVGQETYNGSSEIEETGTGGYLFAHTGNGDGQYYRLYYALSHDGLSWTELNGGESPMPTYYGFPCITKDASGTFWLIGVSNTTPRNPVIWKSTDMVNWTVYRNIPRSVMALPAGYVNNTNSFGAMKIFFDPVSEQFMITWHACLDGPEGPNDFETMQIFYILTTDFETFTPAQRLFNFTGSDADTPQIDAIIYYDSGRYYAVIKDETEAGVGSYYKRPRMCTATSLTGPYSNPSGQLTPAYREAPTLVKSPDGNYWYLYVEYYNTHIYELYRSASLNNINWTKMDSFTPPSNTNCRHGCVIPIDAKVYRRLQSAY